VTGDKATRYLILLAALALAAYGQHIIDSREAFGSGWLAIDWLHDELTRIYGRPQSVALALPLLGFGAWFFVESINPLLPDRPSVPPQPPPRQLPRLDRSPESIATIVFGVAAIGAWVLLLVRLYGKTSEDNSVIDWWIFWSALVASALALGIWRRLSVRDVGATVRWHPLEYAFAAALAGFFIGLMSYDLDAWQYARIGDEGVFWDIATSIADGTNKRNFFTYQGANGYHPMFSSIYQGWVMKAAGADMFGWKLSNTLAIAAALPVFYWLVLCAHRIRQHVGHPPCRDSTGPFRRGLAHARPTPVPAGRHGGRTLLLHVLHGAHHRYCHRYLPRKRVRSPLVAHPLVQLDIGAPTVGSRVRSGVGPAVRAGRLGRDL
jgi:hypothetical protein